MAVDTVDARHLADAWVALDAFFRGDPYFMTRHHIDSYDRFLGGGLAATLRAMKTITLIQPHEGRQIKVDVFIGSKEVRVDMPTVGGGGGGGDGGGDGEQRRPLLPNEARLRDLTYAVNVYADVRVEYRADGELIAEVPFERQVCIGQLPLMLHSRHCLLHGLSREALREAGECPNDRGGYFVIDGKEKVVIAQEAPVKNRLFVRRGEASKPDIAFLGFVRCDSPEDSFPRTTTFYVRSPTAPSRRNTISVIVTHLGNVRSGAPERGGGGGGGGNAINAIKGEVPLFVLFRALGIESDKAIMGHVVYDVDAPDEADVIEFLRASAIEAARLGVTDQRTAAAKLAPLVRQTDSLKQVLIDDLFPNVGKDFAVKALFLGHVVRRVVRAALGKAPTSDRDDYANKRLDLSGFLLGDLFRDVFLRVRRQCINRLGGEWQSGAWRTTGDVTRLLNVGNLGAIFEGPMLTERIRRSMKGDWGPDEEAADPDAAGDGTDGMVQDLSRVSYMSYVSHVRRLNNPVDRSVKMAAPHELRASHWGAICPVESPDGPNVGLLNHLATLSTLSMGSDDAPAREAIAASGHAVALSDLLADGGATTATLLALRGACKVLVNDTWAFVTYDPPALVKRLRELRKGGGPLHPETSIAWSVQEGELHVHTDRGRFMRPLAVAVGDPVLPLRAVVAAGGRDVGGYAASGGARGRRRRQKDEASDGRSRSRSRGRKGGLPLPLSWRDDLLASGALELVDVEELKTLLVAMRPSDVGPRHTHCELHVGAGMLSISANTFPMMHHNMASRNVLGMAQFKQAIGTYSTAFLARMDTIGYVLHHPQRPLVGTTFADALCGGQWAHGENLVVAVCTYTGYNMEDSVLINRDAVHRGRFHMTYYETHRYEESDGGDKGGSVVAFGNALSEDASVTGVRAQASYEALGPDGLPTLDAEVREGDVLLGRVETLPGPDGGLVDRSVVASRKSSGIVDRVAVYPSPLPGAGAARVCKVRTRQHRAPVLGDKLGSRFSQKGCVGLLMPATDMPFGAATGMVPDILMNPHGFPSRCTVSHLIECLLGKAAAAAGARYNVNSVEEPRGDPRAEAATVLERLGLERAGEEVLQNGRSGEQMQVDVFVGLNYYGRLKHMVADKYQHRLRGPVGAITRQPVKTEGSGGLRIGEMEQNALLAHGLSGFLKESFADRSDRHRVVVDADEGEHAAIVMSAGNGGGERGDVVRALPRSGVDGGPPRFATVEMPYAFKLLQQELASMSIGTRLRVEGTAEGGPGDTDDEDDEDDDDDGWDDDDDGDSEGDGRGAAGANDDADRWDPNADVYKRDRGGRDEMQEQDFGDASAADVASGDAGGGEAE